MNQHLITTFRTEHRLFVYGLVCPKTGECRYIGKTCLGVRRLRHHWSGKKSGRTYKDNWLRGLDRVGLIPEVVLLEVASTDQELLEAECRWIVHAREQGWPLTNLTDGGDGAAGRVGSEKQRAAVIATHRGTKWSEERRALFMATNRGRSNWFTGLVASVKSRSRPVVDLETGTTYPSVQAAAAAIGVAERSVIQVLKGRWAQVNEHHLAYAS
jgi:hypothetical protein